MEGVDFELLLGNGSAQLVDLNLPVFRESLIICSNLKWRHDEVNPGDEFGESPAATRTTTLWFRLALIESERICKTCRPEFESRKRTGISLDCKFAARTDQDWMYCSACEVEHPTLCFSSEEILKQSDRVCIARTGYVRICAHEVLTWDEMKAGLGDTNDFWTKITKTCKHPSHKIHQVYPKDDLILPTALAERTRDYYYLTLSAGIHTKSYDEAYHQDDRMNDYVEYRNHMLPLGMMQMAREFDGKSPRIYCEKMVGQTADISCEDCPVGYECRRIYHRRSISPRAQSVDLPGHSWYHAISPESYSYAGRCGVPETCSDPSCRNYYSSGIPYWHADHGRRYLQGDYMDFEKSNPLWRKKKNEDSVV
ncbi:uncharacterized protein FPRO_01968 [Fusarium proliferatum ET1]|uniref:Uncharacterized protein n=1 Tax=Fusarium proliferatum (strain ET1) TaxID=1227346 RepID=A0A1L7UZM6_FUSPR|nr:uncharacterized protein FPRO_01968 [Fusarium proliferatum ET1]CZR32700.1 uncharacterized protein FPRO_01968 [Fusarium proliferatum ET1]